MTVIRRRVADKLMPWVAANATAWPSTHANQAVLLEQIKELEAEAVTNRVAVERAEKWERLARRLYAIMGEEGERLLPGDLESSELLRDGGQ